MNETRPAKPSASSTPRPRANAGPAAKKLMRAKAELKRLQAKAFA